MASAKPTTEHVRELMSGGDTKAALKAAEQARRQAASDKDLEALADLLEVATAFRDEAADAGTRKKWESLIVFVQGNLDFLGGSSAGAPSNVGHASRPPQAPGDRHAPHVLEVKGVTGTVRFDGRTVTLIRTGFRARATVGKGEKQIPLPNITAVQLKPAGPLVNGYIQFTVGGGKERRSAFGSQTRDAGRDENSVVFNRNQSKAFEGLRDAVQTGLADHHAGRDRGTTTTASIPEQIVQLGQLRDAGLLTDEEFAAKKAELLSRL